MMFFNSAKTAIAKDVFLGIVQVTAGYVLAIFFGLAVIASLASGLKDAGAIPALIVSLSLTAGGVVLILRGTKRRKLIRLFREYAARLAADPCRSIDLLAAAKGIALEKAKGDIQEMIHRGYFTNAYLDSDRNCLVFSQQGAAPAPPRQAASAAEFVSVSCRGCGAANRIRRGAVGECEFCGNPLPGS